MIAPLMILYAAVPSMALWLLIGGRGPAGAVPGQRTPGDLSLPNSGAALATAAAPAFGEGDNG